MCLGNGISNLGRLRDVHDMFDNMSDVNSDSNVANCDYSYANDIKRFGNLSILHVNIRSLNKNMDNLKEMLAQLVKNNIIVDILLICETWLNSDNSAFVDIDGYNCYLQNRDLGKGGGVAIYIQKHLESTVNDDIDFNLDKCYESLFVDVKMGKKTVTVGEIYRVPNSRESLFIEGVQKLLQRISSKPLIIGSDQNLDLLKSTAHKPTSEFLEMLLEHGLVPLATKPTRVSQSSSTLIDNVYLSLELMEEGSSNVVLEYMSDHFPCLVQLRSRLMPLVKSEDVKIIYSRKMNDKKYFKLNNNLLHKSWINILSEANNVTDMYTKFILALHESLDRVAPLKKLVISGNNKLRVPWMTVNLLKCSNKCKRLYKKSQQEGGAAKERFLKYRNMLNKLKSVAKREYYTREIHSYKGNCKKIWQMLNGLLKGKNDKSGIVNELLVDGEIVSDKKKICDAFNIHFSTVGESVTRHLARDPDKHKKYLTKRNLNALLLNPVSETEIVRLIDKLPNKTSRGLDNISNVLIKRLKYSLRVPLMLLMLL